jgi:hypothetical protein
MASNNIERFTWYTVEYLRLLETVPPWTANERVMKVSDHERVVEELEARVEHLQDWQAGLMKTTVAWSEQGINSVSLPDAISVVEGIQRRTYRSDFGGWVDVSEGGYLNADELLARLRSLSPGETRKLDKTALEPKAAEIVEKVFRGYVTHLSVRTAKQLAMETIGLILDERVSLSPGVGGGAGECACWHCGVVLAPAPKPHCEDCPTECDEEDCDAFGCRAATEQSTGEEK